MAKKHYKSTIASTIESAFSGIDDLASEVREVVDNASGTPRENTSRIQTLSETADTLESLSAPDLPDGETPIGARPVSYTLDEHRRMSRADRRDNIVAMLGAAAEALADVEDETWSSIRDEIENAASELEGCEFPGVFG